MKTGKTITELAKALEDIQQNSRDFVVPAASLEMKVQDSRPVLAFQHNNGKTQEEAFGMNAWSSQQLAIYTDIPNGYFQRIASENPELLARNVNHGLRRQAENSRESRMIRTYRNDVRALVSSRYCRLDCYDLFETVAPIMLDSKMDVVSSEITDRRMYIKAVSPRMTSMVKVGDTVQYGLVISSSDVGSGSVRIEPLIYRLVCLNGLITDSAIRKFHIGRSQAEDDVFEMLTDQTKDLSDLAFWSQVRDVILNSMKPEVFEAQVDRLRLAANEPIKNFDIPRVVELAARQVGLSNDGVKRTMAAYLANGADGAGLTKWGLVNAFTHAAGSDEISYDDATWLERAGSKIIDLTPRQWSTIASAPAA